MKTIVYLIFFGLVYKILMFCTTTALAYITFNRKCQLLQKLDNIMNNAKAFGQTCIASSYLTSIVATYTIVLFIFVITWNDNKDMKHFCWYFVIYPQCVLLMFVNFALSRQFCIRFRFCSTSCFASTHAKICRNRIYVPSIGI